MRNRSPGGNVSLCLKDAPLALHLIRRHSPPPVSLRLGQTRVLVPTGNQFNTAPLLRSPRRGRLSRVAPRGSPNKHVLPRTRKLSPLCISSLSVTAPGLPVLRGGLGGRSRIEPRISTKSLFAGATRGSLAAQSPECAFLPRRSLHKQRMPENSGDAVGKTLSKPEPDRQVASSPFRKLPDTIFHGTLM